MSRPVSITLLHATPVAMQPVRDAFASAWPEATVHDLLDDGLTSARAKSVELTQPLQERFVRLARYAHESGADGILVTCSAFGPAIEQAARLLPIPVCKPNEAMFQSAIACGDRIVMLATFAPAVSTMEAEFAEVAALAGSSARLTSIVVDGAMDCLRRGDVQAHNRLIADRARALKGHDAVVLAHFSTARAVDAVSAVVDTPVFTAPESAVRQLRRRMEDQP